jgi:transposase
LAQQLRETPACKTLADIPGIGLMTATAVVASMGSPAAFHDGREFAASIGLAPRQTGTGGRVRQLGISKRGDAYLRTLLTHGARRHRSLKSRNVMAMAGRIAQAQAVQRRRRCGGKQTCSDHLGDSCQRPGLARIGVASRLKNQDRTAAFEGEQATPTA